MCIPYSDNFYIYFHLLVGYKIFQLECQKIRSNDQKLYKIILAFRYLRCIKNEILRTNSTHLELESLFFYLFHKPYYFINLTSSLKVFKGQIWIKM